MNENFILTKDNIFTKKECDYLVNFYKNNVKTSEKKYWNYNYYDINEFKYINKINNVVDFYVKKYPEVNMTSSYWKLTHLRYKLFEKNKGFTDWHSEHTFLYCYRVLALQIYLSNHSCGTQFFYNKKTILSKIGRVCIFPAYFTHTHRGQICPDGKERSIITGYISFFQKGDNE